MVDNELEHISRDEAIEILRRYASDKDTFDKIFLHSQAVCDVALDIASKVDDVDLEFIETASLLHDIGRFSYNPRSAKAIRHGIEGAKILRGEGLEAHASVAERHIGVGLTKQDIQEQMLFLPDEDFVPCSKEEIIICYADNLICGTECKTESWVEDRFVEEIGPFMKSKVQAFHKKVHKMMDKEFF